MTRLTLTFDWNCIIALENKEDGADAIDSLINLHRAGRIEVALLAVSGSENTRQRTFPQTMKLFEERIRGLGLADLPLVPVPAINSLTYLSTHTFIVDGAEYECLTTSLWKIMFPNAPDRPADYLSSGQKLTDEVIWSKELKGWRNMFCDVISAYSHIHADRDVFVTTNTDDFQNKQARLKPLGLREVLTPREALLRVTGGEG